MPVHRFFAHVPKVEARAAMLALVVGTLLTAAKFVGYFLTGSSAIFTDAMESIVNLAAGAFALYSLTVAHRPADESHPYGHGKVEFLSAALEGSMVLAAGVVSLVKAVDVFSQRSTELHIENLTLGLLLMGAAFIGNAALGLHLLRIGKKQGSITLESDGKHLLSDAWTSLVTIAAICAVRATGWLWADPLAGMAISLYVGWIGISLLRRAEAGLTDRQDKADTELLASILDAHLPGGKEPTICSYHKVRHRHTGRFHWVEFHMVVPAEWSILRGHEVATVIEEEIESRIGEGNATAHVEPCVAGLCQRCGPALTKP